MKRGFLFTTDSFLALVLLTIMTTLIITSHYTEDIFYPIYLRSFSMEMQTSFEKSDLFAKSIYNFSQMQNALNATPPNLCVNMQLANSSSALILNITKINCPEQNKTVYISYRTIYAGDELYLAKSKVWNK